LVHDIGKAAMASSGFRGIERIGTLTWDIPEGVARYKRLQRAIEKAPNSEVDRYRSVGTGNENPNLSFRLGVHDPLVKIATSLVHRYGDDYSGALKFIQGDRFKSTGQLFVEGAWEKVSPSPIGVASAGAAGGTLSWVMSMIPAASRLLGSAEFSMSENGWKVRHMYFKLLDQLSTELAGGNNPARARQIYDYMRFESGHQFHWDEAVAEHSEWKELPPTTRYAGYGTPPAIDRTGAPPQMEFKPPPGGEGANIDHSEADTGMRIMSDPSDSESAGQPAPDRPKQPEEQMSYSDAGMFTKPLADRLGNEQSFPGKDQSVEQPAPGVDERSEAEAGTDQQPMSHSDPDVYHYPRDVDDLRDLIDSTEESDQDDKFDYLDDDPGE
jgi:hypothetical protein